MIKVALINKRKYPVSPAAVARIARTAAKKIKKNKGTIDIAVVGDRDIKKLNRLWRKVNRPTDVLAFAWDEDKKIQSDFLGQIVISYPRIVAQAKEYCVPLTQEFARILVHGIMHLAGYDHNKSAEARKMFALQESIIKDLF